MRDRVKKCGMFSAILLSICILYVSSIDAGQRSVTKSVQRGMQMHSMSTIANNAAMSQSDVQDESPPATATTSARDVVPTPTQQANAEIVRSRNMVRFYSPQYFSVNTSYSSANDDAVCQCGCGKRGCRCGKNVASKTCTVVRTSRK